MGRGESGPIHRGLQSRERLLTDAHAGVDVGHHDADTDIVGWADAVPGLADDREITFHVEQEHHELAHPVRRARVTVQQSEVRVTTEPGPTTRTPWCLAAWR